MFEELVEGKKGAHGNVVEDVILDRCGDCYTQNPNESLNGCIWARVQRKHSLVKM